MSSLYGIKYQYFTLIRFGTKCVSTFQGIQRFHGMPLLGSESEHCHLSSPVKQLFEPTVKYNHRYKFVLSISISVKNVGFMDSNIIIFTIYNDNLYFKKKKERLVFELEWLLILLSNVMEQRKRYLSLTSSASLSSKYGRDSSQDSSTHFRLHLRKLFFFVSSSLGNGLKFLYTLYVIRTDSMVWLGNHINPALGLGVFHFFLLRSVYTFKLKCMFLWSD